MSVTAKWLEMGMWLLSDTNRKPYVGSLTAPLYLTVSDLEGQMQGHSHFEGLYLTH